MNDIHSPPAQDTIQPVVFKPSDPKHRRSRITPVQMGLALLGLIAGFLVWFLFTSKSVQINFTPPAESVTIGGGLSFEMGGVWLLREGPYTLEASTELYEPIAMDLDVGEAR